MGGRRLLAALTALSIAGCAPISVSYDYDPAFSFGALRTFGWLPEPGERAPGARGNDLVSSRIRHAVETQLEAKGYRKADGTPDFYVAYHAAVTTRLQVDTMYDPGVWGPGPRAARRGWGGTRVDVREYDEGTLILDVFDAGDYRLRWRGTATAVVNAESDPQRRTERINEAVRLILEKFPPPSTRGD
jgi:hypothetical protein